MAKNISYDKKIFRMFYILNKLNEGYRLKTLDLAKEFDVTVRTVQRDILLLSTVGFPLVSDARGYKFTEGFSLHKITVTPEEKLMLSLFYKLFSKVSNQFSPVAKNVLDKFLVASKTVDYYKENDLFDKESLLKKEFDDFSKRLAIRIQNRPESAKFQAKIKEFTKEIKQKVKQLAKEKDIRVGISFAKNPQLPDLIFSISVPKSYFKDPYSHLHFGKFDKERIFKFIARYPDKLIRRFSIEAQLTINYKFWGNFLKCRQVKCFDEFMEYLVFSRSTKRLAYEASFGNEDILITRVSLYWSKEIPMAEEDIRPFFKTTRSYPKTGVE